MSRTDAQPLVDWYISQTDMDYFSDISKDFYVNPLLWTVCSISKFSDVMLFGDIAFES